MLVIRLFKPILKHFIVFSLEKEELLEIWLLILLALMKSNALEEKIGYTLDNFQEAVPISLFLTLSCFFSCSIMWPGWVIVTAWLWHTELLCTEILGFAQSIFPFSKPIRHKLSELASRLSSPFKFAVLFNNSYFSGREITKNLGA